MSTEDFLVLGRKTAHVDESYFGLNDADRKQHVYIVGKTGTGKSSLLKNMMIQDVACKRAFALVDPHGDLAQELLDFIPSSQKQHTIYFDVSERERPIGLNLFADVPKEERGILASEILSIFKSRWADSWGVRMEYILFNSIATLLEYKKTTVLAINRLLADDQYRRWVLKHVTDPVLLSFWRYEYEAYTPRFRSEVIAPIQNKIGQLSSSTILRNIFGQVKRKVHFDAVMDRGKIFIANLAKGKVGESNTNLLGSVIVSGFQLSAMRRASVPINERRPFTLYVDEFQNFTTESFSSVLSEARKYGLNLVLAHQFTSQLDKDIRDAIFGNVGSKVAFRVGSSDADLLQKEFESIYPANHFTGLENYEVCVHLMGGGKARQPFTGRTLNEIVEPIGLGDKIVELSRVKYGRPKKLLERKLSRWVQS